MIAALAAAEGRTVATVDITGAYLNADMPDGYEVLMRLDKEITRRVVRIRPTFKKFVRHCTVVLRVPSFGTTTYVLHSYPWASLQIHTIPVYSIACPTISNVLHAYMLTISKSPVLIKWESRILFKH